MATSRLPWAALTFALAIGSLSSAHAGVRLGTVSVGAGVSYSSGPLFYGPYSPFFFGPWSADPYWGSPVYFAPQADKGQVSLRAPDRTAEVYLNNAYAGTASELRKFWLSPGVYELQVRGHNGPPKSERIYVLTGKTLKVNLE
jgi:hypothetical protein